jgi:hypothetical protein
MNELFLRMHFSEINLCVSKSIELHIATSLDPPTFYNNPPLKLEKKLKTFFEIMPFTL